MTVRSLLPIAAACCLAASAAAECPTQIGGGSLSGNYLAVEGYTQCPTGRCPDPCADGRCANYLATVRDGANNVTAGAHVWIDFSSCQDIRIACDQLTAETGQVYVSPSIVEGYTNASGQFTFKVQGTAIATPPTTDTSTGTNAGVPCAAIYACGVLFGNVVVAAYDVNALGSPGAAVNASDVSLVQSEALKIAGGGTARARDDYNGSNTVNAGDVAIGMQMALQAAQGSGSQITGPYCP